MKHYAGLDVSIKETCVCIVDGTDQVVREVKVTTEPEAILAVLADESLTIERIGRGRIASYLCRDAAHEGGAFGTGQ